MPLCVGGGWLLLGVAGSLDWVWDGTANPYRSYPSAEHLADGEAGPRHEVHAVLLGSSHPCAIPLNGATLPVPWAEVTPSCLRIQSRGAGWALFYSEGTGRLFRSRFGNDRLAEAAALTFQQALRAYPIRRLPLVFLGGSSRPRIRRPVLVPRPRYSDNVLPEYSLFFSRDREMACRCVAWRSASRHGGGAPRFRMMANSHWTAT
jgi:hypothetical protein